jgi:hypothetical protein
MIKTASLPILVEIKCLYFYDNFMIIVHINKSALKRSYCGFDFFSGDLFLCSDINHKNEDSSEQTNLWSMSWLHNELYNYSKDRQQPCNQKLWLVMIC